MKKFLILGGNFVNTGAEAMTFVTVNALRGKYPDCKIIMFSNLDAGKDNRNYLFDVVHMSGSTLKRLSTQKAGVKYYVEGIARIILRKGNQFYEYKKLLEILSDCDGVFDISGFTISSQFRNQNTLGKLSNVDLFTSYGIPFYFMPQSFGPFEYQENREYMLKRLRETLPKATKIFVRENEGYEMLRDLIGEGNITRSYDMVLQSSGIDKAKVYKVVPEAHEILINTERNVAIVPNMRNFDHGNKEEIIVVYNAIIERLLANRKTVYLISHSSEDVEACRLIKDCFKDNESVLLIKDKIDSWNYGSLIKHFDFAIASRFHSIVHAYLAGTPCIALGWATKYHELLESVGQQEYIFDVRTMENKSKLLQAVTKMCVSNEQERIIIRNRLAEIQKTNCFDLIDF